MEKFLYILAALFLCLAAFVLIAFGVSFKNYFVRQIRLVFQRLAKSFVIKMFQRQ